MKALAFWVVDPSMGMFSQPHQVWECTSCGAMMREQHTFAHPGICPAKRL